MQPGLPNSKSRWKTFRTILLLAVAIGAIALYLAWPSISNGVVDFEDIEAHFKYGSIGSEPANGIPYWIWKALPELFADKLPGKGYASLGFIQEEGQDRPIGFSNRRVFIDRVSLNCGVCHTGSVRESPGAAPRIITGMPANTMDLAGYTRFLLARLHSIQPAILRDAGLSGTGFSILTKGGAADVNYGGSTGYGREYCERLNGTWGIVDVEDCIHAAHFLAGRGDVDPKRMAIRGGSAGGYTTLSALVFHRVFAAGAIHYGVAVLTSLATDTHKFRIAVSGTGD